MTPVTVSSILLAAFQDCGRQTESETSIPPEEAVVGLRKLQTLVDELANGGAFGTVRPRLVTAAEYTATEQARIAYSGATSSNITLPTTVASLSDPMPYGEEVYAEPTTGLDLNNRAPRDHALVEIAGTLQIREVYDALYGDWVRIDNLALVDAMPLARWRGEFIAMLVPRVALPLDLTPQMERAATLAKHRLVTNPTAPRSDVQATYF